MQKTFIRPILLLASAGIVLAGQGPIVLTFEGLLDGESVNNFYNGGTGSRGSAGFSYGVTFTGQSIGLVDSDVGGSGNFANAPSPRTIMYFPTEEASRMNVLDGFTVGFSFYYAASEAAFVTVYDGFNGTGTVLNTLALPPTPLNTGRGDPTGAYDTWIPFGISFDGTARSVVFSGAASQAGFDNITFGAFTPSAVPEPGTYAAGAFIAAAAAATWWRRRRQAK